MKILPLTGTELKLNNKLCRLQQSLAPVGLNTSELLQRKKSFDTLRLSTFNKLLEINYTPKKLDGYYSTFIINKSTGTPETVFVKHTIKNESGFERFDFYIKGNQDDNLINIGNRSFLANGKDYEISPGSMISSQRDKYSGIGIREHQITIERMTQIGAPNIIIEPAYGVELFHEGCGFEKIVWSGKMLLSKKALEEWNTFINSGQRILT